jgi:hypothetical protein
LEIPGITQQKRIGENYGKCKKEEAEENYQSQA